MERSATFWIVLPQQVRRLVRRLPQGDLRWCYLGTDRLRRDRVARWLGQKTLVSIGDDVDRVAVDIRSAFLEWMSEIGARQPNQRNWWMSRMASKSPLQSTLFLLVCYAHVASRWMGEGDRVRVRMLVVENPWLAWVLRHRFSLDARVTFLPGGWRSVVWDVLRWVARMPLAVGRFLVWSVSTFLLTRSGWGEPQEGVITEGQPAVLLYTWVDQHSVLAGGVLQDPFMGRLGELLSKHGERVIRLTPLQVGIRRGWLRALNAMTPPVVITPRYLRLWDLVASLATRFEIKHLHEGARFQGWDCAPLLYQELLREWTEGEFAHSQLWYRAVRRFARREGRRIKCVIYPCENQPWEKMLCLAFRCEAPAVRLIGYQHSSVGALMLNYCLGEKERAFAPLPHQIVTNGALGLRLLAEGGFPPERLVDGGALRYEYLFRPQPLRRLATGVGKVRRVLVALPLAYVPAMSLLRELLTHFLTPYLNRGDGSQMEVEFVVKCHPMLPITKFMKRLERLPPWITVSEWPLRELLETAALFLYTPTSTSSWEAYLMGVPVLKYQDGFFAADSIDAAGPEVVRTCSWDTLRADVETLLQRHERETTMDGDRQAVLRGVFSPVDETAWTTVVRSAC